MHTHHSITLSIIINQSIQHAGTTGVIYQNFIRHLNQQPKYHNIRYIVLTNF